MIFPFLRSLEYPGDEIDSIASEHEEIHRSTEMLNLLKEMNYEEKEKIEDELAGLLKTLKEHIGREDEVLRVSRKRIMQKSR